MNRSATWVCSVWVLAGSLFVPAAWACKPMAGMTYHSPTEVERLRASDLAVVASVDSIQQAADKSGQTSSDFYVSLSVQRWLKGHLDVPLVVVDTYGTDCDRLSGIRHIVMLPRHHTWRVYLRNIGSRLWVTSAESLD